MTIEVQGVEFALPADAFSTVGFSSDQALLPYPKNVYDGYRILQEYLSFPEAFHFFDVKGFAKALPKAVSGDFTLRIHFSKTLPADTRVRQDNFQLYCTPVINLFEHDADPIDLTGRRSEYRIVPSSRYPAHYEIFSVDQVVGWQDTQSEGKRIRGEKRIYSSFESFQHEVERVRHRQALYYRTRVKESIRGDGFDSFISFVRGDETLSMGVDEASQSNSPAPIACCHWNLGWGIFVWRPTAHPLLPHLKILRCLRSHCARFSMAAYCGR